MAVKHPIALQTVPQFHLREVPLLLLLLCGEDHKMPFSFCGCWGFLMYSGSFMFLVSLVLAVETGFCLPRLNWTSLVLWGGGGDSLILLTRISHWTWLGDTPYKHRSCVSFAGMVLVILGYIKAVGLALCPVTIIMTNVILVLSLLFPSLSGLDLTRGSDLSWSTCMMLLFHQEVFVIFASAAC